MAEDKLKKRKRTNERRFRAKIAMENHQGKEKEAETTKETGPSES